MKALPEFSAEIGGTVEAAGVCDFVNMASGCLEQVQCMTKPLAVKVVERGVSCGLVKYPEELPL